MDEREKDIFEEQVRGMYKEDIPLPLVSIMRVCMESSVNRLVRKRMIEIAENFAKTDDKDAEILTLLKEA
jgi:hypothetical protein